jgi:hypothetical protein
LEETAETQAELDQAFAVFEAQELECHRYSDMEIFANNAEFPDCRQFVRIRAETNRLP